MLSSARAVVRAQAYARGFKLPPRVLDALAIQLIARQRAKPV